MAFDSINFVAYALFFLRLIVAIVFFSSGKSHFLDYRERSKSIGLSANATKILGLAEMIGAIAIAFGLLTQIGALLLIAAMVGALYKKIFIWKIGFYAEKGFGWHYDLLLLFALFVIFATGGGYVVII